jgi:hypothetical protein
MKYLYPEHCNTIKATLEAGAINNTINKIPKN